MNKGITSLNAVRALVTRPEPQAGELAQAIIAQHGQAVVMPMINIQPLSEDHRIRDIVLGLDLYDQIIVTSRPAAQFGLELIEQYWPQLPIHLQWFAIGKGTASTLAACMIKPCHSDTGVDSEALLSMPELQNINDSRILIIKGKGGRTLLPQELERRGASITTLEVYQRQRCEYSHHELVKQLESHDINVILCGSGETVTHLGHYLPELNRPDYLVIVPSERVARHALALGFQQVHNANGASHQAMLSALSDCIQISPEGP